MDSLPASAGPSRIAAAGGIDMRELTVDESSLPCFARACARAFVVVAGLASILAWAGPASAADVVVFDAKKYVDTSSDGEAAEADNIRETLKRQGHSTDRLTKIGSFDFNKALDDADVLVIPELEKKGLADDLSSAAKQVIVDFVESGGGLIINGTSGARATDLLNELFGWSLTVGVVGNGVRGLDAVGTAFATVPSVLPDHERTRGIEDSSLPAGAMRVYRSGIRTTIAMFRRGLGTVVYLGWDWFDAKPRGSRDGGWLEALDAAMEEAGLCFDTSGGNDSDGDGIADACDADGVCTDVDGQRSINVGPKLIVKKIAADTQPGNDGLRVLGKFRLPAGTTFDDLDPTRDPFMLLIEAADGRTVLSTTLPPVRGSGTSPGWRLRNAGTKWAYLNESASPPDGIVQVVLKDRGVEQLRRIKVSVSGVDGTYPVDHGDEPLTAVVVVGDGTRGECGVMTFTPAQCRFGRTDTRLICIK